MKKESLWIKDVVINNSSKLNKNINVDVVIIGGGLTGISSAYYLKDSNLKVCLLEQGYVGMGVTSRTTGKITYLQETIYSDLEEKYSYDVSKLYFESQKYVISEFERIIEKENIDCDFDKVDSVVYTDKKIEVENIKMEKKLLEDFGIKVKEYEKLDNNLKCKYGISVSDTYVFHPLKFLYKLKEIIEDSGIKIYEQTRVKEIVQNNDGYLCYGDGFKIFTKKIIVACHYPFFLKPFMMPLKVYTEKSYIGVGECEDYKKVSLITSSIPVKSMRYHKDKENYIFYLSESHNICNNLNDKKNFDNMVREASKLGIKLKYLWSNDDMISVDRIPYIGRLEYGNNDLLIGTAYSTWGMTNGLLAGYLLSNMIMGIETKYELLFNPLRACSLKNISSCFKNVGSNLKSMLENKIVRDKKWYGDNIKFEIRNGKRVAIYKDGDKEYVVLNNCPHMGCTLLFNEIEKTWDCPCHASRFNLEGKCIKGPSSYDISYKDES